MAATETLATVRTEFSARGFSRFTTTQANWLINDAYAWVVNKALWPFRFTTAAGAAPLTVADLGLISSVKDTANGSRVLSPLDRRTIEERFNGDLTVAGTPAFFYVENKTTVKTYPAGGTLTVAYWKKAVKLVADGDVLIVPDDWVQLVIDRACYRGALETTDWQGAAALRSEVDNALVDMMNDLLMDQAATPDQVEVYGGEGL